MQPEKEYFWNTTNRDIFGDCEHPEKMHAWEYCNQSTRFVLERCIDLSHACTRVSLFAWEPGGPQDAINQPCIACVCARFQEIKRRNGSSFVTHERDKLQDRKKGQEIRDYTPTFHACTGSFKANAILLFSTHAFLSLRALGWGPPAVSIRAN